MVTNPRALLLSAIGIAAFAKVPNAKYTLAVEDEDSRRLRHVVVVDAGDRRERGGIQLRQPS